MKVDRTFQEVLEAAREGAEWAWRALYDDLAPAILGYLRARSAPDPDGVCGEVFCQLVRDLHRFEGDESGFRSWVFVMAHHRLLDEIRRRKRRPETLVDPGTMWETQDASDVEAEVVGRAGREQIRRMVDELTPPQRDVLLLRIYGGLSVEETARAVRKRAGAVKALQRRGLESIRRRLEIEEGVSR